MPYIQIQLRRGTSNEWETENPVLALAELAVEIDTNQFKIGDGITPWNQLPYGGLRGEPAIRYEHIQTTPSLEWIINHNFGYNPMVQVFTVGGLNILCDINNINTNIVQITFNTPTSGKAILI